MDLYLIRHPRPDIAPGICYGASDIGLAGPVAASAERIAGRLPPRVQLYASPLRRARLLAEALGEPVIEPRLREMSFGEWELQPFDSLRAGIDAWAARPLDFCPPGGESVRAMAARALAALDDLRDRHRNDEALAIIAHGGPLRAIAGHLLGLPAEHWHGLDFSYGRLAQLRIDPGGVRLRAFNL